MLGQCDQCIANAKVRVTPPGGSGFKDLVFCQHHYDQHALVLMQQGWKATNTIELESQFTHAHAEETSYAEYT